MKKEWRDWFSKANLIRHRHRSRLHSVVMVQKKVCKCFAYLGQGTLGGHRRSGSSEFLAAHVPELCCSLTNFPGLASGRRIGGKVTQFFQLQGHLFGCELAMLETSHLFHSWFRETIMPQIWCKVRRCNGLGWKPFLLENVGNGLLLADPAIRSDYSALFAMDMIQCGLVACSFFR